MPALAILILGIIMISHSQGTESALKMHFLCGMLWICFSAARILTYLIYCSKLDNGRQSDAFEDYERDGNRFLSRTTHPPSELLAHFSITTGAIVFMFSARDIVHWLDVFGIAPNVVFCVASALTLFSAGWVLVLLALSGWLASYSDGTGS
jgi:hypothetical protein